MAVTRQVSRRALILQPSNAEVSTNQVYAPRYEFLVDGELSLPVPRIINSLKHTDAAASIYRVDISVNKGGTSSYRVLITSYNQLGVDPIVHVDEVITLTTDRLRTTIPVIDAAVGENRSLECTITEQTPLFPATDMTVTVIMEDFADITVDRQGHRIVDVAGNVQAQKPDLQFIGAVITEDNVNQRTVVNIGFIGQYLESDLTLAQHQSLYGNGWVLADGVTSCVGSLYETITGRTVVPDARGVFLRGKNNGSATAFANPDGDLALGTLTQDKLRAHTHSIGQNLSNFDNGGPSDDWSRVQTTGTQNVATTSTGGNETAPKSLTVNIFIKIN
jgi:hypothetical protein